jgi:hypothetical protein
MHACHARDLNAAATPPPIRSAVAVAAEAHTQDAPNIVAMPASQPSPESPEVLRATKPPKEAANAVMATGDAEKLPQAALAASAAAAAQQQVSHLLGKNPPLHSVPRSMHAHC